MRKLYEIRIEKPNWEGYKYALFYSKLEGNCSGGATEFKSKTELLRFISEQFERWKGFDCVCQLKKYPFDNRKSTHLACFV